MLKTTELPQGRQDPSAEPTGENMTETEKNGIIVYVREPTDLQCGQAVLAMVTGLAPEQVTEELGNERETNLKEMKSCLRRHGLWVSDERVEVRDRSDLPALCMLSLETPRCWHWSLFSNGIFYDPEHGVMDDFPECARKYYWEIRR